MTPIKAIRVETSGADKPPSVPLHSWWLIDAQFISGIGIQSKWALVADEAPASTANPSEADIAARVELLQESCSNSILERGGIRDNEYGAIVAGKCYIVTIQIRPHWHTGEQLPDAVWSEATPEVFRAELRRVAIRQLLAERGGK